MVRALVIVILVSLLIPLAPTRMGTEPAHSPIVESEATAPSVSEILFPEPIDTSAEVTEYTQVSRALMLSGGSSDVALSDMDDDGQTDLIVAVYEERMISIFYRQVDGTFLSYSSYNITTLNSPFRISPIDVYANGGHQIVSLERGSVSGTYLVVYNLTSPTSSESWPYASTYANAEDFTVGLFSSAVSPMDTFPDIALVCAGPSPSNLSGVLYFYFGPDFQGWGLQSILPLGFGANAVVSSDIDDDTFEEVLVSHYFAESVMMFEQPFNSWGGPARTLDVEGSPTDLAVGLLNDDARVDLAVTTESPSAVRIFSNSLGVLPITESYNATLDFAPSKVFAGDASGDGDTDLLILSQKDNLTAGFYQRSTSLLCQDPLDFKFPVGALPRAAVMGDMDGDLEPDIVIASASLDWSGSNIALYPARSPTFSNANATAWIDGGLTPSAMATGDVDGDDVVDLVVISENSAMVECYLGFGGTPEIVTLGYVPRRVIVADFNEDGFAEVLLFSTSSKILSIVSGASLYPGSVRQLTCGGKVMDVTTGDLDNRHGTDIVAATDEGEIDIFFNSGESIPFSTPHEFSPTPGVGIRSIAVGDFDTDGLDDIAYTHPIRTITVLYQSQTSAFSTSSRSTNLSHTDEGLDFTAIWSGDITGDGKDDIVGMRPPDPSLYLFDQLGFISSPYPYATLDLPEAPSCVSVMDATDDGPSDVVAIFGSADLVFLYRQNGSGLPDIPSMVFVAGARPVFVAIGDGTSDHRGDLLSLDAGSRTVSIWEQINFGPVADAGGPYYDEEGSTVQFEGSAITGTSEIPYMEYNWSFGDGSETGWVRNPRPTHVYLAVGNFTVDVDVRDPAGLMSSDSTYVIVEDASPHVSFTWSPESVAEGVNVTFEDTSTSYDPVVSRGWTVDGVLSGVSETLQIEFQDGNHSVMLELADSDGSIRSLTEWISVGSLAPDLRLTGPTVVTEGVPAQFQVFVDEWHGEPVDPIVLYEWDFFYVPGSFVPDPFAPNSDTATRTFSADSYIKVYRVAVRVTDSDGKSNVTTWDIWVYDTPPNASFVISDPTPVEGTAFSFLSYSTSYDGVVNWTWELEYPGGGVVRYYDTGQQMALRQFDCLNNGVYRMTLTIRELDGNASSGDLTFTVLEAPPAVVLSTVLVDEWPGYYEEFYSITFKASVRSLDNITSYEWDFNAQGGEFIPDLVTIVNNTAFEYGQVGNYTAKVRVTDSDKSSLVESVFIEIRSKPLGGGLGAFVRIVRDPANTNNFTIDFLPGLYWYEDLSYAHIDFDDGSFVTVEGADLLMAVHHTYLPGRDYVLNGTFRDDDGYEYSADAVMWCDSPSVKMINPMPGAVVRSGTQIVFQIERGSTAIHSALYSVDGGGDWGWTSLYTIDTSSWVSWNHSIVVTVRDYGGNIVRYKTYIIVDNVTPEALLSSSDKSVYAGDHLNVTIRVDDQNIEASGIVLFVRFQGDSSFSSFTVGRASLSVFYRVLSVPLREGNISFYANVTDLAGNSMETQLYSVNAEFRFLQWAWPYLLLSAVLSVLGTGGYFYRESRLAVDEAFVVYNDGRLIAHSTRRLKPGMDDHVLGSMFVAIQDFVRDSFKDVTSFTLRRLDFGDKSIVIEKGPHIFLAAVLHGQASRKVAVRMQQVVTEIEESFGEHLDGWDGNLEKTRGVSDILQKMYSKTPLFPGSLRRRP